MRGKYSPTVSKAYQKDSGWFDKFCKLAPQDPAVYNQFDPDGFDSYGYDKHDVDRAGNQEHEYYSDDYESEGGGNWKYDAALDAWGFDGTKPVRT